MKKLIFILLAIIGVSQAQTIQYIGAPTTTVISRGNFRTDSIFYLPKRTKLPTDTAALRYQISDSSLYAWTGSQWRKVGADADTLVYSTRAWRQKGDDSLAARINLKLNISDTASMLTPYLRKADTTAMLSPYYRSATASAALALKLNISDTSSMLANYIRHAGYGLTKSGQSFLVDTLNIATRAWRQKGLDSLAALEVSGSGTTNYVAKFTASTTIGNSSIVDNGTGVGVGISPTANTKLYIRTNTATDAAIYSDNGTNTGFIVKYGSEPITNIGNDFNRPLGFLTNNTERLRITSGGDVGIGTTSPSTALHINRSTGNARITSTATQLSSRADLSFTSRDASNNAVTYYSGSYGDAPLGEVGMSTNHALALVTNNAERLRIFANGRVGINTTTDAGYQLDVNGTFRSVNGANFATTSGNVGIGTASPSTKLEVSGTGRFTNTQADFEINATSTSQFSRLRFLENGTGKGTIQYLNSAFSVASRQNYLEIINSGGLNIFTANNFSTPDMSLLPSGEVLISTTTDAGDYKLQVVGNARIGTGKLDIASNTTFGIGVARSGTSEVAGQIYNSNGILYLGAESSAGGQIFSGSSAYAAVIGSGANYPLQFATNNATRATINTAGELLIATTTDNGDFKLQVNGNALISGSIKTANGGSSTAVPWHLGSVVATSVQLDTNNYVEVEINGTFYRLAIVTPL